MKRLLIINLLLLMPMAIKTAEGQDLDTAIAIEAAELAQHDKEITEIQAVLAGDECAICMGEFDDPATTWALPKKGKDCGHLFHKDCIARSVTSNKLECPICRVKLTEADVPPLPEQEIDFDALGLNFDENEGGVLLEEQEINTLNGINNYSRAQEVRKLNFNSQFIRNIPARAFENYENLMWLNFYNNYLGSINPDAFQGLDKLEMLGFGACNIGNGQNQVHLTEEIFAPIAHSLKHLDLSENNLIELPVALRALHSLEVLALFENPRLRLSNGMFRNLPSLKILSLSSNELKTLPDKIFEGLPLLEELVLSENQLEVLPKAVNDLHELIKLDLSKNQFKVLLDKDFEGLHLLEELDLSGNQLEALPVGILKNLTQLAVLDLCDNNFSSKEQERIKKEVVNPDCQIFFNKRESGIFRLELTQNAEGYWVDPDGLRYEFDEDENDWIETDDQDENPDNPEIN